MSSHENNPFSDTASVEAGEKKDSKDSKKKSSKEKQLGAFLVKPESEEKAEASAPPEKEGLFKSLFSKGEHAEREKTEASSGEEIGNDAENNDLEALSPEESAYAEQELARAEMANAEAGIETPAEEVYEQGKVEEFYERIAHAKQDPETALQDVLSEIEHDQPETPEAGTEESVEIDEEEEPATNEVVSEAEAATAGTPESARTENEDARDRPDPAAAIGGAASSAGAAAGAHAGGAGTSGSGSGGRPPAPPAGGQPPHGPRFGGAPGNPNFGAFPPAAVSPNTLASPKRATRVEYRNDTSELLGAALIGGIVGYLIGRRRGRIKTEKKLLPVQEKLEKKVVNLQEQLKFKERQIRQAAREKVRLQPLLVEQAAQRRAVESKTPDVKIPKAETPASTGFTEAAVVETVRIAAPEAAAVHNTPPVPERIGKVVVTAEVGEKHDRPSKSAERMDAKPIKEAAPKVEKHVETMSRAELLAVSDKIIIDGSSLRQIYETHLVGERGLRRLVSEHLRGGNVKKALRREIVEREIDFERDPVMRDLHSAGDGGGRSGGASVSPQLQALVQKAAAGLPSDNDNEVAFLKARAKYQEHEQAKQRQRQQMMDVTLSGTILLLVVIIVWLLITHS